MNVISYIGLQKAKIRAKYVGEEFFIQRREERNAPVRLSPCRSAEAILTEMDSMAGLNTAERTFFAFSHRRADGGTEKFSEKIYPSS